MCAAGARKAPTCSLLEFALQSGERFKPDFVAACHGTGVTGEAMPEDVPPNIKQLLDQILRRVRQEPPNTPSPLGRSVGMHSSAPKTATKRQSLSAPRASPALGLPKPAAALARHHLAGSWNQRAPLQMARRKHGPRCNKPIQNQPCPRQRNQSTLHEHQLAPRSRSRAKRSQMLSRIFLNQPSKKEL